MPRLVLIDTSNLLCGLYYTMHARTRDVQPGDVAAQVTAVVARAVRRYDTTRVIAALDHPDNFRNALRPTRRRRAPQPTVLRGLIESGAEVMHRAGALPCEAPGYAADDVIATLSARAADGGENVIIISTDADLHAVLRPKVAQQPKDGSLYTWQQVVTETGLRPDALPLYRTLGADQKTAHRGVRRLTDAQRATLAQQFTDVSDLLAHLTQLPDATRVALERTDHDRLRRAERMIRLVHTAPVVPRDPTGGVTGDTGRTCLA